MLPVRMDEFHGNLRLGKVINEVSREDTPSTVCSEPGEESSSESTFDTTRVSAEYKTRYHAPRIGTSDSLTKGPFRFPEIPRGDILCRPICLICQNELIVGQTCRELRTCGHCFHASCLEGFLERRSRCPVCYVRCKPVKQRKEKKISGKAYWSPDFDSQLLSLSDKLDRERRLKLYLMKGKRDNAPRSYVFLKSGLPTLLEESPESLETDDGTMMSLCRCIARERQIQKLRTMDCWSKDMKRLAITFMFSVICMYIEQAIFVDLFEKKLRTFSKNIN